MKRYTNKIVLLCVSLGLATLTGCKSRKNSSNKTNTTKQITPSSESNSIDESVAFLKQYITPIPDFDHLNFKINSKFDIEGQKIPIKSAKATVRMNKEKIWMSITAIMGIEAARILITKDSVKILNRLQSQYICGPTSKLMPTGSSTLDFNQIQAMLIGRAMVSDQSIHQANNNIENDQILSSLNLDAQHLYSLSSSKSQKAILTQNIITTNDAKSIVNAKYQEFNQIEFKNGAFAIAKQQDIRINTSEGLITLSNKIDQINQEQQSMSFKVPSNYKQSDL